MRQYSEELSPREWAEFNNQKEMWELQATHSKEMKLLELEAQKLESKWNTWIKIPVIIITLPVRILFIIPLTVYAVTHQEIPEFYKKF